MKFLEGLGAVILGLLLILFVFALMAGVFGFLVSVMNVYDPLG